jgi:hypothetical protein
MNFFAVLDDSDDENVTKQVPKKTAKKEAAPEATKPAPKSTAASKPARGKPNGEARDTRGKPKQDSDDFKARTEPDSVVKKEDQRGGHHKGGKGDRERRPRDNGAVDKRGKREYDRKPSSNRNLDQRKEGRGPHSFGNVSQEAQEAEKDPSKAEVDAEDEAVEGDVAPAWGAEEEPEPEAEPEPTTFTFDDYMAKRNEGRANKDIFGELEVRRDVETIDLNKVKDGYDQMTFIGAEATKGKKEVEKKMTQRALQKTKVVDVAFKAAEQPREEREYTRRDDRGGRGGDRREGGRGRGGGRGGERGGRGDRGDRRSSGGRFNINDDSAFPSL